MSNCSSSFLLISNCAVHPRIGKRPGKRERRALHSPLTSLSSPALPPPPPGTMFVRHPLPKQNCQLKNFPVLPVADRINRCDVGGEEQNGKSSRCVFVSHHHPLLAVTASSHPRNGGKKVVNLKIGKSPWEVRGKKETVKKVLAFPPSLPLLLCVSLHHFLSLSLVYAYYMYTMLSLSLSFSQTKPPLHIFYSPSLSPFLSLLPCRGTTALSCDVTSVPRSNHRRRRSRRGRRSRRRRSHDVIGRPPQLLLLLGGRAGRLRRRRRRRAAPAPAPAPALRRQLPLLLWRRRAAPPDPPAAPLAAPAADGFCGGRGHTLFLHLPVRRLPRRVVLQCHLILLFQVNFSSKVSLRNFYYICQVATVEAPYTCSDLPLMINSYLRIENGCTNIHYGTGRKKKERKYGNLH